MKTKRSTCRYCTGPIWIPVDLSIDKEIKTRFCGTPCRDAYWAMQREQWDKDILSPDPSNLHKEPF